MESNETGRPDLGHYHRDTMGSNEFGKQEGGHYHRNSMGSNDSLECHAWEVALLRYKAVFGDTPWMSSLESQDVTTGKLRF